MMLKKVRKVVAVELDEKILPVLRENVELCLKAVKFGESAGDIDIIHKNILEYQIREKKYKVLANIPYYLTSPIIKHFLYNNEYKPEKMVLMVQKEVAERICDERKQSVLSLMVKVMGKPEFVKPVKKTCFYPVPKVDSAVLKIDVFKKPIIKNLDAFLRLIKIAFGNKRKQFAKSLAEFKKVSIIKARNILSDIGLDEKIRAEDISLEKWGKILNFKF